MSEKKNVVSTAADAPAVEKTARKTAKADKAGNVWYKGSAQNFNRVMATAADLVIVEAEELVEVGEIEPENVMTPGILVNYIVVREGK